MPIYEYECQKCGSLHEMIQKFSEGPKRKCPKCGELALKRLISAPAFHLKGDGWYVTDFRDKDKKKAGDKAHEKDKADSKEGSSKSETSDDKGDSKSKSKGTKSQAA